VVSALQCWGSQGVATPKIHGASRRLSEQYRNAPLPKWPASGYLQREFLKIAAKTAAFLFRDGPAIGQITGNKCSLRMCLRAVESGRGSSVLMDDGMDDRMDEFNRALQLHFGE
jgi:hypothetical protein